VIRFLAGMVAGAAIVAAVVVARRVYGDNDDQEFPS
jgi:hypothetical protein